MRGRRTPKREWSGGVSLFPVGGSCGGLSWSLESLIIVEEILGEEENLRDGILVGQQMDFWNIEKILAFEHLNCFSLL